ncbi:MAG: hypothetical protein GWP91_10740 [Rhodobacterales bacterium]|nr:hypothetical protein [Rhodobacterales bacterium]
MTARDLPTTETLTRRDLASRISAATGVSDKEANELLNAIGLEITKALVGKRVVAIRGFGVFTPALHAERMGRNPRTGDLVEIPKRWTTGFRPSTALRERMQAILPGGENE